MCMMCEEEAMYQAYINYLVRKAQEKGEALTAEENSFLEQAGVQMTGIRTAGGFSCDPLPADESPAMIASAKVS
jgi:hypothetical protein